MTILRKPDGREVWEDYPETMITVNQMIGRWDSFQARLVRQRKAALALKRAGHPINKIRIGPGKKSVLTMHKNMFFHPSKYSPLEEKRKGRK